MMVMVVMVMIGLTDHECEGLKPCSSSSSLLKNLSTPRLAITHFK